MRNDFGTRPYKSRFGGSQAMKKVLKQMEDDPAQFVTDVQGDYVPD